jgi:hypothetical protein
LLQNPWRRATFLPLHYERHPIQDDLHAGRKMTRQPGGKSGKKNSGTWKLDTSGFCTTWKGAGANCYTVVPSGKNKWSIQKGSTTVAVWTK